MCQIKTVPNSEQHCCRMSLNSHIDMLCTILKNYTTFCYLNFNDWLPYQWNKCRTCGYFLWLLLWFGHPLHRKRLCVTWNSECSKPSHSLILSSVKKSVTLLLMKLFWGTECLLTVIMFLFSFCLMSVICQFSCG
jgi:hypothetical protein